MLHKSEWIVPTPEYLILPVEKAATCRELFQFAGRIGALLGSKKVQASASMQASLDDLLGAVYSLVYSRNHAYDDRQNALAAEDIQAVAVRAMDMSAGKLRTDGKWTAGYYVNSALFRIAAIYHRTLKIVGNNKKATLGNLRPLIEAAYPEWKSANLERIHSQVNDLKHEMDGIYKGRKIMFDDALRAVDELLNLIEAWKQQGVEQAGR